MDEATTSGSLASAVAVAMAVKAALTLYLLEWGCAVATNVMLLGNIRGGGGSAPKTNQA